ncbi:hypothetical protein [Leptospirillum ferriphilum]|uniref:Uncharacterized protein n=1 Tax=Leptospirillum ferriphilum TaxID=178606 RepID=A0A2I2MFI3_9BACT|nr:hypothetical protein [Leptospirillum ferriphilum]
MATKFHDKGFRMSVSEKKRQESTLDFRLLSLETTIQELILVLQEKQDKRICLRHAKNRFLAVAVRRGSERRSIQGQEFVSMKPPTSWG